MDQQEMKIIPPEGYEVDKENSTFECIKFKHIEPQLPKTWKEFCETHPLKEEEAYINNYSKVSQFSTSWSRNFLTDKNVLPSEKYAEAMLALCQLIQLQDCYNNGWEPDWLNDVYDKWCIEINGITISPSLHNSIRRILAFKGKDLRDKFLENFKDLIEIAKPLL